MKLDGQAEIRAPRAAVWAFLMDPERAAACLPGDPSIEALDGGRFRARAKVRLGFFSATVVVDIEYVELHEPADATVRARGQAPGGGVVVAATLRLSDLAEGSSVVDWSAEIEVTGMLAAIGQAQIEASARSVIADVLGCAKKRLEV